MGLSPRVRGNQFPFALHVKHLRSIPACAGEPSRAAASARPCRVYPRVCGGTTLRWSSTSFRWGLSPRVRGNLRFCAVQWTRSRSIPACAGEPRVECAGDYWGWVYPRVCGGTRRSSAFVIMPSRSIPACAGEPVNFLSMRGLLSVYPRVCGGTSRPGRRSGCRSGLSPRVRGNHDVCGPWSSVRGSIPACAGEPTVVSVGGLTVKVYPRVCGGTIGVVQSNYYTAGLSPRVRGNRIAGLGSLPVTRSIPACAGEPGTLSNHSPHRWVYPRVCGGTSAGGNAPGSRQGLSPRVRGNPAHDRQDPPCLGSIPACAGNRQQCGFSFWERRSIPACAGEPIQLTEPAPTLPVYPRVCGGTTGRSRSHQAHEGLSPRVRGNRIGNFRTT